MVGLWSECYRPRGISGCFPGPAISFQLGHLGETRSQWPAMRRANSEHDAPLAFTLQHCHVKCSEVFIDPAAAIIIF